MPFDVSLNKEMSFSVAGLPILIKLSPAGLTIFGYQAYCITIAICWLSNLLMNLSMLCFCPRETKLKVVIANIVKMYLIQVAANGQVFAKAGK
jgi:hypothetical protein